MRQCCPVRPVGARLGCSSFWVFTILRDAASPMLGGGAASGVPERATEPDRLTHQRSQGALIRTGSHHGLHVVLDDLCQAFDGMRLIGAGRGVALSDALGRVSRDSG